MRALAVVLLLAPVAAFADCAMQNTFVVPEKGTLPANAVLHVFAPGHAGAAPEVTATDSAGASIAVRVTAQPSSDAFHVFRVDVSARKAEAITVRVGDREFAYTVKSTVAYATPPVKITKTTSKSFAWTCSHHSTRDLAVTPAAPVYRVNYAKSEDALRAGKGEQVLLPHRALELAYRWKKDEPVPEDALLQLGHLNCTGDTMSWKQGAVWASIVAIFPDGSETPASDPVLLEPPAAR